MENLSIELKHVLKYEMGILQLKNPKSEIQTSLDELTADRTQQK